MINEFSFESNTSINSDEEIKQVKICPFQTHFQYYYQENTQISNQNEEANEPIPSPQYKFMGMSYSNDESADCYQSIQSQLDKCKLQDQVIQHFTINVSKSVDIWLDNKRNQKNNKSQIASMQQIKINTLRKKNAAQEKNYTFKKPRHHKNARTTIKNVSPQGILKTNPNTQSYQMISNKKVSFEFTQEQIKSMKKIKVSNVLIKQKTRFVLN